MSVETDLLAAVAKLGGVDRIGALEEGDRTALLVSSGKPLVKYRDGTAKMQMGVLLHGRDADQCAIMSDMGDICDRICARAKLLTLPDTRIMKAEIGTAPAPFSVDASGRYLYKATLLITYIKSKYKEEEINESK